MTEPDTSSPRAAAHLRTLDCVHCGLCLEHCPTYLVTGRESANPRGRVYLMRALLEERVEPRPDVVGELDLCLLCRACETACPSGVRFGEVMSLVRSDLRKRGFLRRWLMDRILPDPTRLRRLARLIRAWQGSPLRLLRLLLPRRLRDMEGYLPPVPAAGHWSSLAGRHAARGPAQGVVALLEGCVASVLFQDVNRDSVKLLTTAGYDVVVPAIGCCGALHEHDGALQRARELAAEAARALEASGAERIVTNSAGCGAALQGYGHLLGAPAGTFTASRSTDITRFLLDHGHRLHFTPGRERVVYDAPCHLHHAQGEAEAPLALLGKVPGVEAAPLPGSGLCCGAAGVYNLDQPGLSGELLDRKLEALEACRAGVLLTGNPGCLLQWRHGVRKRGLQVRVEHPVTFLARRLVVS